MTRTEAEAEASVEILEIGRLVALSYGAADFVLSLLLFDIDDI